MYLQEDIPMYLQEDIPNRQYLFKSKVEFNVYLRI
jgi:hypothetical protein